MHPTPRTRLSLRAALVAGAVSLAACGSDGTPATAPIPERPAGTFAATVTGGATLSLTGGAFFGNGADGQAGWSITLASTDGQSVIALYVPSGALPKAQNYPIVPRRDPEAPTSVSGVFHLPAAQDGFIELRGGVVRVTRATATVVVGEIEVRARGRLTGSDAEQDVFITAPFHAVVSPSAPNVPVGGMYGLTKTPAGAWPTVFDGVIPIDSISTGRWTSYAENGVLTLSADGTYLHTVTLRHFLNGTPAFVVSWVDHGLWTRSGTSIHFDSDVYQNRWYTGRVRPGGVDVTYDFTEEGFPATITYLR